MMTMLGRSILGTGLSLGCLAAATTSHAASFTGLGDLPGGEFASHVRAVSADGTTVVGSSSSASRFEAFLWDAAQGMRGLGEPSGGDVDIIPLDVSGDGSTVVGARESSSGFEAVRWDEVHGTQGLGFLPGGDGSGTAYGASADGSIIVGNSFALLNGSQSSWSTTAFVWDASNGMRDFQPNPYDGSSLYPVSANDVSADGSVVVGSGSTEAVAEAFIWDAENGLRGLGDLPGGTFYSMAVGVSADGSTVVGESSSASGYEAFLWDAENGLRGLGDLPGGDFRGRAVAVSADGSIAVGGSAGASGFEAFIWDEDHGMRELKVVLSALGVDLDGWTLTSAADISADGRTIVGTGINPEGLTEGWIAVIPEPGTGILLGLGLAAIGAGRSRDRTRVSRRAVGTRRPPRRGRAPTRFPPVRSRWSDTDRRRWRCRASSARAEASVR